MVQCLDGPGFRLAQRLYTKTKAFVLLVPHHQAVSIIRDGRASHFDPDIADAFHAIQDEFQVIAARYVDSSIDLAKKEAFLFAATEPLSCR